MTGFIDAQREHFGVESICKALQVAPSGYWRRAARQRNPALLPARAKSDAELQRPEPERIATIEWSRDGMQAVLYLDGTPQALYDFQARCGYCRMDFPNFMSEQGDTWRKSTHAWSDAVLQRFESALYV